MKGLQGCDGGILDLQSVGRWQMSEKSEGDVQKILSHSLVN